ncbi:hypothetical protein OG21DRAFT_1426640 [Imleria badia]|nr:hypothetical protein OG21DRAFT_1426640 [Imleria badia]
MVVDNDKISQCRDLGLRKFELSDEEWEIVEQLHSILKDATSFSRSTPSLAAVIPAMDHIDTVLTTGFLDYNYSLAIRAALDAVKKTLNQYYELTDSSESYRIAMVLPPWHKLAYFKKARWKPEWIEIAENLVREEFERSYAANNEDTSSDEGLEMDSQATGTMSTKVHSVRKYVSTCSIAG